MIKEFFVIKNNVVYKYEYVGVLGTHEVYVDVVMKHCILHNESFLMKLLNTSTYYSTEIKAYESLLKKLAQEVKYINEKVLPALDNR
jgi:hypothetical protein